MTILAQRRPKFKGSFSSMSSASGTSPVSSESNPEGFGNYNTILRSGRSLDQLYKFSIDEDIDISNEKIQNQSNTTNNELGEIRSYLLRVEKDRQCLIDDCNRLVL